MFHRTTYLLTPPATLGPGRTGKVPPEIGATDGSPVVIGAGMRSEGAGLATGTSCGPEVATGAGTGACASPTFLESAEAASRSSAEELGPARLAVAGWAAFAGEPCFDVSACLRAACNAGRAGDGSPFAAPTMTIRVIRRAFGVMLYTRIKFSFSRSCRATCDNAP